MPKRFSEMPLIGGEEKKPKKKSSSRPSKFLKANLRKKYWGDKISGTCFCCGRSLHYDDAEIGHIQARAKGGKWSLDNCRLICRTCNAGMGTMNMKTFMKKHFPKRYEKYFGSETKKAASAKPKTAPRKRTTTKRKTTTKKKGKGKSPFDLGVDLKSDDFF